MQQSPSFSSTKLKRKGIIFANTSGPDTDVGPGDMA